MTEQSIACPSCGKKIPLTRALRAEIEQSVKQEFDEALRARERELRAQFEARLEDGLQRTQKEAAKRAEKKMTRELAALRDQIKAQTKDLDEARRNELVMRKRERELERKQQELELDVERQLGKERARLVTETHERLAEEHRLKDAEKERQLADMRRQIEDLKRKAEQGSQQLQGEVAEEELATVLSNSFPSDDIRAIGQGVRGADLHQMVIDSRGRKCGSILWECKNTRNWNDAWLVKLKQDQRTLRADLAVLVSAVLPKGCTRFDLIDGVVVTDFPCAPCLAGVLRANLFELAQTRSAAMHKEEKLELLHRYLSGVEFRQRVEAVVEAFTAMRHDLDQERRAAERQWARRARQIDAVTLNVSGMYGDLQGILPALPSIRLLELPAGVDESSSKMLNAQCSMRNAHQ